MSSTVYVQSRESVAQYIAMNAGALMLDLFRKNLKVEEKHRHDYVTELDRDIESMAKRSILQAFPDDGFMGEEGGASVDGTSGYQWIIDPIDGTNNFVRGLPLCGFQLALLQDGLTIHSLIYRPFTQEIYTANKGKGAFYKNVLTGEQSQINVSDRHFEDAMVIYDAQVGKRDNSSTGILLRLADNVSATRVLGVAVFDIPAIASGVAEILVTGIAKPYDVAPGMLLLEEAGGECYNIEGHTPSLDDEFMIFSTKTVKDDVLRVVKAGGMR